MLTRFIFHPILLLLFYPFFFTVRESPHFYFSLSLSAFLSLLALFSFPSFLLPSLFFFSSSFIHYLSSSPPYPLLLNFLVFSSSFSISYSSSSSSSIPFFLFLSSFIHFFSSSLHLPFVIYLTLLSLHHFIPLSFFCHHYSSLLVHPLPLHHVFLFLFYSVFFYPFLFSSFPTSICTSFSLIVHTIFSKSILSFHFIFSHSLLIFPSCLSCSSYSLFGRVFFLSALPSYSPFLPLSFSFFLLHTRTASPPPHVFIPTIFSHCLSTPLVLHHSVSLFHPPTFPSCLPSSPSPSFPSRSLLTHQTKCRTY